MVDIIWTSDWRWIFSYFALHSVVFTAGFAAIVFGLCPGGEIRIEIALQLVFAQGHNK